MAGTPEAYIDTHRDEFLAQLLDFLRIPSISTDPAHRADVRAAAGWVAGRLAAAGPLAVEILETGGHPVVYGEWLGAPAYRIDPRHRGLSIARTVLQGIYGQDPVAVLIGGTLPVSEIFHRVLGIDTVYFSFSTSDEDYHAPNEFFRLARLWDGLAAWTAYWRAAGE